MLYNTIEELDKAISKINYMLISNRAYTKELLEEYLINSNDDVNDILTGIEYLNTEIIKEFRSISTKLTTVLKQGV